MTVTKKIINEKPMIVFISVFFKINCSIIKLGTILSAIRQSIVLFAKNSIKNNIKLPMLVNVGLVNKTDIKSNIVDSIKQYANPIEAERKKNKNEFSPLIN